MWMTKVKQLLIAAVVLSGCGGGKKADTTPDETSNGDQAAADQQQDSAEASMVPPEKMEEIVRMLDRKERIMARCLADAVETGDLPKSSHGKITLEIVISPSGSPDQVKVIAATLQSEKLNACVIGHVKSIQFPQLPKPYPTSHTYRFEAN